MSDGQFTHVSPEGQPKMVDISNKSVTRRTARARAVINPGKEILAALADGEIVTKKGPVFQTAIIAGVMGAKKTSELIPFCHPIALEDCQINIAVRDNRIVIDSTAVVSGKTGVEMEALSAATIAALTVYDMCKALSHDIIIESIQLLEKTGGKKDIRKD